ncbi:MAG: serine/threonine-protein kinase [Chloroflexota bacterium]
MQRLLIIATLSWLLLSSWATAQAQEDSMLLSEALAAELIESQISGRSIAYTQPMLEAHLTNLTNETIILHIPQGQQFELGKSNYASVVIGQQATIELAPQATVMEPLLAFSLDPTQAFPAPNTNYAPTDVVSSDGLITLLQRIESREAQAVLAAQLAVWMHISGNEDFEALTTQLNTEIDLQSHRSLTLDLLGQSDNSSLGAILTAAAFVIIGLVIWLLRREIHKTFDGYRLRGHIATGVKYHIRQAQQRGSSHLLAIKEPVDTTTEARCLREIEIREQIDEAPPHIVEMVDSGYFAHDKQGRAKPYLVENFVDGADLSKVLSERNKLGQTMALEITSQLTVALSYLHERYGIIHRDIQPSNILIDRRGKVWLTDFSSAIDPQQAEFRLVQRNEVNNHYWLAPEMLQWKQALYYANGTAPQPRPAQKQRQTDIFSLGVLLYQLAIGKSPFQQKRGERFFEAPTLMLSDLSHLELHVAAAIKRCLDPNPAARFQTMIELESALKLPLAKEVSRQARAELGRIVQDVTVAASY